MACCRTRPGRQLAVADELISQLRPATPEEWAPRSCRPWPASFGETPTEPYLDHPAAASPSWTAPSALFDGEPVAATAGIYSLDMTVPGGVVPWPASPG